MKTEVPSYNVIMWDINRNRVMYYDIIPYLLRCWEKYSVNKLPKTFEEFMKFIDHECKYQYWARCEYEFLIGSWPPTDDRIKIDVYDQVKNNLEVVTKVFMDYILRNTNDETSNDVI